MASIKAESTNRRLYPIKNIIQREVIPVKLSHNYNIIVYKELYPIHTNEQNYTVNNKAYINYLESYQKHIFSKTGLNANWLNKSIQPNFTEERSQGNPNQQNPYSKIPQRKLNFPIFSTGLVVGFNLPDAQISTEQMNVANVKYPVLNSIVDTPTFSMEIVEDSESNVLTNILLLMASQFHMAHGTNFGRGVAFPPFVIDGLTIEVLIYSDYPNPGNVKINSNTGSVNRDSIQLRPQYRLIFRDCMLTSYTNTGYQAAGDRLQYTLNFAHKHIDIKNGDE